MKIIDAHIHFSKAEGFTRDALAAGHENTAPHIAETFRENNIAMGIVMGAGAGEDGRNGLSAPPMLHDLNGIPGTDSYHAEPFISYCCGVQSELLTKENTKASLAMFEHHLRRPECVGIKMYPGYNHVWLHDPRHAPFYDLARSYDVPVVIHTGDTASSRALLKYAHPLTVDEVAVKFPEVRFIMAHCGNPWIVDAVEVAAKNPNVSLDLSGLAEGFFTAEWYCSHFRGYLEHLRTWLTYLDHYEKVLYGSDWPLVHIPSYIQVISSVIPEKHREDVFFFNALRHFPKLRELLSSESAE